MTIKEIVVRPQPRKFTLDVTEEELCELHSALKRTTPCNAHRHEVNSALFFVMDDYMRDKGVEGYFDHTSPTRFEVA